MMWSRDPQHFAIMRVVSRLGYLLPAMTLVWTGSAKSIHAVPRGASQPDSLSVPRIPFERFTLPNGLTVVLIPDRSAPVVTVTVWYHVGSKNELPGRTGFAHLFEHVMFQGSAHVGKTEHIKIVEDAGGEVNGTTNNDRTMYYETVPANYLSTAVWLEADRMGSLLSALTQEKLDNQRDVVKNERRYRVDNQPYGRASEVIAQALFPASNPYSWPVIGSMADLSAASLDDVKQFFRTYYAPNDATLAICGDLDTTRTRAVIEQYFGPIARGPAIERPTVPLATLAGERRLALEDPKATLPRLEIAWPTVGVHSADGVRLNAAAAIFTQDRISRLTKLLVYDLQLATSVAASNESSEDEGSFHIRVSPRPGVALTRIEQLVDSVVAQLGAAAPTAEEVERAKHYAVVGTITGLESTDARADELASGQIYFDDPLHYREELHDAESVGPADVQRVVHQYLGAGRVVLSMVPSGKLDLVSQPANPYVNVTLTSGQAGGRP
jgi:zinc protease